jgi:putative transposase
LIKITKLYNIDIMVRQLRVQYEGAFYHIISRGNAGNHLYVSDEDKDYFLKLLRRGAERYEVEVYAYCVMETHYHLLVQTRKANLSDFMHFLGSSYGSYISKKGWIGHVFAGRYKALCIQKEEYLLTVSRYIHLNPVEAGIVERPQDYKWSSYLYYIEDGRVRAWLNKEWLVEYFGPGVGEAKSRYRVFVEALFNEPPPYPHEDIVAQTILGSEEFVKKIQSIIEKKNKPNEATGKKYLEKEVLLNDLYDATCRYYELRDLVDDDGERMPLPKHARKTFIFLAREHTPATNGEIAESLMGISANGVSRHYARTKRDLEEDESFRVAFKEELMGIMSHVRG